MAFSLENTARAESLPTGGVNVHPPATLSLLYHEVHAEQSAYGYAIGALLLRDHLALFARLCMDQESTTHPKVTFDDGHISNFEQALPALVGAGVSARFFITAGWTSKRPEFMTWEQLREMVRHGQQIGAHGWSHKLLTHCTDEELTIELVQPKQVLEDKLGVPISTLSLPGGRCDRRVLRACHSAGYTQIFTSVPRLQHSPQAEMVGRLNLRAGTTVAWLEALFAPRSQTLAKLERVQRVKELAQHALGDNLYMKLWSLLNRAESGEHPA